MVTIREINNVFKDAGCPFNPDDWVSCSKFNDEQMDTIYQGINEGIVELHYSGKKVKETKEAFWQPERFENIHAYEASAKKSFNDMVKEQRDKNNSLVKNDDGVWEKAQDEAMRDALCETIDYLEDMLEGLEKHDETQRRFLDSEYHKYGNESDGSYLGLYMLGSGNTPLDKVQDAIENAINEVDAILHDPNTYTTDMRE